MYALLTQDNDFARVFDLCDEVEEDFRRACYHGLGRSAFFQSIEQQATHAGQAGSTRTLCALGGDHQTCSNCVAGAVRTFIYYNRSDVRVEPFCGAFDAGLSAICLRAKNTTKISLSIRWRRISLRPRSLSWTLRARLSNRFPDRSRISSRLYDSMTGTMAGIVSGAMREVCQLEALRERLLTLIDGFHGLRVMVVGDLVLDHYLVGDAGRISREYPVIILNHERDEYRLGGAANTVANLAALGADVEPAGWIGADANGDELRRILARTGCSTDAVVRDPVTRTVAKTRIVAGGTHGGGLGQHLLRVDQLGTGRPDAAAEGELLRCIEQRAGEVDGFVLSDYGQGTVTGAVARTVVHLAEGRYVGLDSRHRLLEYPGITAATPNLEETEEATGRRLQERAEIESAGESLRGKLGAEALLITLGAGGVTLFEAQVDPVHIPVANRSEVFDVTGAGDTVVAVFTLARLSGGSYLEAAHLANMAGGISVRHAGATPVRARELREALDG